jgi:hypothetical protein
MFFSSRTQMNIFLRNIQQSEYADVATTLQSHVNAYLADDDEGYLPTNLCINGIATAIHTNALSRVRDVGQLRVRQVAGDWDTKPLPAVAADKLPLCAVQGYCPWVYGVDQGQDRFRSPSGCCPHDRDGPAGRGGHGFNRDKAGRGCCNFDRDGGQSSPRNRSICPDQRRCSFLHGVQCDACKCLGHEASSCDMLAIALFLDTHVKHSLSDDDHRRIELNWIDRWKKQLKKPQRSPSQVMKAYCTDMDISLGHLDLAMDWECWPVWMNMGTSHRALKHPGMTRVRSTSMRWVILRHLPFHSIYLWRAMDLVRHLQGTPCRLLL